MKSIENFNLIKKLVVNIAIYVIQCILYGNKKKIVCYTLKGCQREQ